METIKSTSHHNQWKKGYHYNERNQSHKWCPRTNDNEKVYKKNLLDQKNKKILQSNNWIDCNINYSFNEYGYRCDSFKLPCTILFSGCSQTFGLGLDLQSTWAWRVSNNLDIPYHNIACPGSDWQHTVQRLLCWIPILKPTYVIIKEPPTNRFNWHNKEKIRSTASFSNKELLDCSIQNEKPLIDIIDSPNTFWYKMSMTLLLEYFCKEHNVTLITLPTSRIFKKNGKKVVDGEDVARDLDHFGRFENYMTSLHVIEMLEKQ